ncbi:glycosyltransferase family 2 protein [Gordonia alkanivorans]|uniref:glycosyltransferase family 2 protein n=1 Tax=Gordonia alkanivorans TaxID=84096 RepID=UPI002446E250|nr:glycosyltransferase family 2 protein [Gordonia alkanivorans]MDH3052486.1 glycosyltransferase family 2 protein [Gordonia alkanivorans]
MTYNDRNGFINTCASVFSQSLDAGLFEHLVIDGASIDGTPEWYRINRPTTGNFLLVSEPDKGIYDAMNKGIALASGDYICFLNAGDVLLETTVLEFVAVQLSAQNPDWAYGLARVVDETGRPVRKNVGIVPYSRRKHLLSRSVICHQSVWMRRSVLEALLGFDESFGTAADYHLLLRAGQVSEPASWNRVLVDFLTGGVSDSGVYRHIFRRHKARVSVMKYGRLRNLLDLIWTGGQAAYICFRQNMRRAVDALLHTGNR